MTEPLSWIWVAQVVVIIGAVAAGLLAIMWIMLRGRSTWHHVITYEVTGRPPSGLTPHRAYEDRSLPASVAMC
jgi:hypothetical protein